MGRLLELLFIRKSYTNTHSLFIGMPIYTRRDNMFKDLLLHTFCTAVYMDSHIPNRYNSDKPFLVINNI